MPPEFPDLQDQYESRDDAGRITSFGGITDDGVGLSATLATLDGADPNRVGDDLRLAADRGRRGLAGQLAIAANERSLLSFSAHISTLDGEARVRALGEGLDYYLWVGGEKAPVFEGTANGRLLVDPIDYEMGDPPESARLAGYIPVTLVEQIEPLLPLLRKAIESVPVPDDIEKGHPGPGAALRVPYWIKEWPRARHQCWGISGATGSIVGMSAGSPFGPPGMFIGGAVAAYVFNTLASICAERFRVDPQTLSQ